MMINKVISGLVALTAVGVMAVAPAHAFLSVPFATTGTNANAFSYTSGGALTVNPASNFLSAEAVAPNNVDLASHWSFTGLGNNGFLTNTSGTTWLQNLTGGTFTLKNTSNSTTYITGTFTDATLDGSVDGSNPSYHLAFAGVSFTGGTWWADAQAAGDDNPGAFTMTLLQGSPVTKSGPLGSQHFSNFTAHGSGNLDVTPPPAVPEPGTVASFFVGALGLCALALRARRSVRPVA